MSSTSKDIAASQVSFKKRSEFLNSVANAMLVSSLIWAFWALGGLIDDSAKEAGRHISKSFFGIGVSLLLLLPKLYIFSTQSKKEEDLAFLDLRHIMTFFITVFALGFFQAALIKL